METEQTSSRKTLFFIEVHKIVAKNVHSSPQSATINHCLGLQKSLQVWCITTATWDQISINLHQVQDADT
jgi:hypothetical protein